ncbi:hypothetical protein DACRYDRAFT_21549 [Dacryopinax primogenitus]|uniref:Uncharacterized protein n=1 Tax=Dacryopinax primogenitus (strain DJM 731) TaxID=1858805 RepID=M5G549_DACPD|nr:uncharacterized protein DACRYDRAFT_21549 [Dacryopinax primogenitus]EJU03355.1 hypothetical protein DACRYDRAFT_21549 [Dacryopinax primogenitus]
MVVLLMIPASFSFQMLLVLLTTYNPHTLKGVRKHALNPVLRVIRKELLLNTVGWLTLTALNGAFATVYANSPLASAGLPLLVASQAVGYGRLYLHLKSRPWDTNSRFESDAQQHPTDNTTAVVDPGATTTWTTARSTHVPQSHTRHRVTRASVEDESEREAAEVLASIDEDSEDESETRR